MKQWMINDWVSAAAMYLLGIDIFMCDKIYYIIHDI